MVSAYVFMLDFSGGCINVNQYEDILVSERSESGRQHHKRAQKLLHGIVPTLGPTVPLPRGPGGPG